MAHRWDYTCKSTTYIGLSTETKDTEHACDGDVFLELDTSKVFVFLEGTWYEL